MHVIIHLQCEATYASIVDSLKWNPGNTQKNSHQFLPIIKENVKVEIYLAEIKTFILNYTHLDNNFENMNNQTKWKYKLYKTTKWATVLKSEATETSRI